MAIKESALFLYFDLTGAVTGIKDPVGRGTCEIDFSESEAYGAHVFPLKGEAELEFSSLMDDGYSPLPISTVKNASGVTFITFEFTGRRENIVNVTGTSTIRFLISVSPCGSGLSPSVHQAVEAVLRVWGANCKATSGPEVEEALSCVNAAIQRIHQSGKHFGYTAEENLILGNTMVITNDMEMPESVQSVVECTLIEYVDPDTHDLIAKTTPKVLNSLGELRAVRDAWKYTAGTGRLPIGYYVETVLPTNPGDAVPPRIRVHFAPPAHIGTGGPNTITFRFKVLRRAPRYSVCDLYKPLPIPHEYSETLLYPLARYYALSSRRFARKENAEPIAQQAAAVLQMLGESDPKPKQATPT